MKAETVILFTYKISHYKKKTRNKKLFWNKIILYYEILQYTHVFLCAMETELLLKQYFCY